jgi:membrane protein YdbS with pleckstrin-like domain
MSYKRISQRKVSTWILAALIALITVAATQVYYMREMLAALIIVAVLFALVAAIVLTLFLLDRASQLALGRIEARAKSFARAALRLLPARSRV